MPLEPLLTLDDAADILRMSRSWVERQVRLGLLKKTKLGFVVRIDPVDLTHFDIVLFR
jgi:Helix-turn-helix domain